MSIPEYAGRLALNSCLGNDETVGALAEQDRKPGFVHVEFQERTSPSILEASRVDPRVRGTLNGLTNAGYLLYLANTSESRFVHTSRLPELWQAVRDGQFQMNEDGIVYSYVPPEDGVAHRLVVVFSPMGPRAFDVSLNRYFAAPYRSLGKFVPPGTGILRVGDVGGVKGAFYLDTTARPRNVDSISGFLHSFIEALGVPKGSTVLYGTSKGGTGGLYHSLRDGWNTVSVDPILGDAHYEVLQNDLHFTSGGIFPQSKERLFGEAVQKYANNQPENCAQVVITSDFSPQKSVISNTLEPLIQGLTLYNSRNPKITDHPSVARSTLWAHAMLINGLLLGVDYPRGEHPLP